MPRPSIGRREVLVRTFYSMVSVGTEVASLRPVSGEHNATPPPASAMNLIGKAIRDPAKAARRAADVAQRILAAARTKKHGEPRVVANQSELGWTRNAAQEFDMREGVLEIVTDESEYGYQAMSRRIEFGPGMIPIVDVEGYVEEGLISIGLLDGEGRHWLGNRSYDPGPFQDRLICHSTDSTGVIVVVANAGSKKCTKVRVTSAKVTASPPETNGMPLSDLDDQGWNVGYSAAGKIIAIGEEIDDFAVGELVACAGAGKANHADYISVPRNLVCRVPPQCDLKLAATATIGAIAVHGVRRAALQIGDVACVIGLGLIGQITAQLLSASGAKVIGFDPEAQRVSKALALGMEAGSANPDDYKNLVRDLTGSHGADRILITAATKSDAAINLAAEVARPKGRVIVIGDVGLNVKRVAFYRKELDLLMSTSYGPGRYDRNYEEEGHDYPYPYVRWTLNRNMQAYMELIASKRINPDQLIEKIATVDEAPRLYQELSRADGVAPLGVLLRYPDDGHEVAEQRDATRIVVRGHRSAPAGPLRYALVGAGAFGTAMLVPQMAKRKDRFFLRGVVSRNTGIAGNFARANRVEVVTTELDDVLRDKDFDAVVIATRHHEHADQVVRALTAGKHVFVEKPLAITREQLETVVSCYASLSEQPLLMVGFNRRFSPAMQALRGAIENRRGPMVITYRLNAGYVSPDSWIQDSRGGGRNIGEACHMYDAFRFLTGASVESIEATAIDPGTLPYLRNDNFCATLRYADGSIGNLVYTALGPREGLPKERVEVFCDGQAYVLDDYHSLIRANDGEVLWQGPVDKGHAEELSQFGDAIAAGAPSPIDFSELVETSAVALTVEDKLFGRY